MESDRLERRPSLRHTHHRGQVLRARDYNRMPELDRKWPATTHQSQETTSAALSDSARFSLAKRIG